MCVCVCVCVCVCACSKMQPIEVETKIGENRKEFRVNKQKKQRFTGVLLIKNDSH